MHSLIAQKIYATPATLSIRENQHTRYLGMAKVDTRLVTSTHAPVVSFLHLGIRHIGFLFDSDGLTNGASELPALSRTRTQAP